MCHQIAVLYALECAGADAVWLVPCHRHAFAKALAPYDLRRAWCEALAAPFGERVRISDIERELGGESRTIDTMDALAARHPDLRFSLVLGSDIRAERNAWKRFDELERRFPILWIGRMGHAESADDALVLPDVSSRRIRCLLREGGDASDFVPRRVLDAVRASGWRWPEEK